MIKKILPFFVAISVVLLSAIAASDTMAPWECDDDFYSNITREESLCPEEEEQACMEKFDTPEDGWGDEGEDETSAVVRPPPLYVIVLRHAEKLKKQARLHWMGSQGLRRPNVGRFFLTYDCYHSLDVEQARKLLVYAVESLLKSINGGDVPHPQLVRYPLTSQDVDVEIRFDTFFGQYVDRQYVELCALKNNIVTYDSFSCETAAGICRRRHERYPDAVKAVLLNLGLANTDRDIEHQRDEGVAVDEAIPFDRIFNGS